MADEHDKESSWMEKMRHTYRLVIMKNETFEEVGSYKLTLLNVYIAASTVVVVTALLVFLLVAFTPIRKYIPGYGDVGKEEELYEVLQLLDSIEYYKKSTDTYTENVRRMLTGDVQTVEEVEAASEINSEENLQSDSAMIADYSEVDNQLRQEIELAEIGNLAQRSRTTNLANNGIPLEQMFFTPPMTGEISAGFMSDKGHYGVDILAPKNTAIKAVMDGYVFLSDWTLETGNTIGIQHSNNVITFYKHNSVLLKKVGSYVRAGEAVAIIGNTGTLSDGPHLHFELWYRGSPVDPTEYVNF